MTEPSMERIHLSGASGSPVPFSTDVQWRSLSEVYARRYQGERLKPQVGDDLRSLPPLRVRSGDRWEEELKTFGREPKDIFAPLDLLHLFISGTFSIEENTEDFLRHSTPCTHGRSSLRGRPVEREQSPNL